MLGRVAVEGRQFRGLFFRHRREGAGQSCGETQNETGHRKLGDFPSIFPSLHPHLHFPAFNSFHGQPEELAFLDNRQAKSSHAPTSLKLPRS